MSGVAVDARSGEVFGLHRVGPHLTAGLIESGQRLVMHVDGAQSVLVDVPVCAGMAADLRALADAVAQVEPPAWPAAPASRG